MGTEKETIEQFAGWENPSQQHDFFGETNLQVDVVTAALEDDVTLTAEEKLEKEKEAKSEKNQEKILDEQFKSFEAGASNLEEEEEEDEASDPLNTEGQDTDPTKSAIVTSKATLAFLADKGFISFEAEEGKVLTETEAENILEDSWEKSIEEGIEESIKGLPEEVQDLIRVASKNGDYKSLMQKMSTQSTSFDAKSDIESEEVQILAVTEDLKSQGYDAEEIETQLEFLKEKGKLEAMGKKAFAKILAKKEEDRKNYVSQVAAQKEAVKKSARDYKLGLTEHISKLEEVKGLVLNKKDKETLPSYISDPTVELKDGRVISELQADLFKVMADKDQIVLLAKVLKSGFDFSSIERKAVTKETRELKNNLQNQKEVGVLAGSSGTSKKATKKAVWDYLDD